MICGVNALNGREKGKREKGKKKKRCDRSALGNTKTTAKRLRAGLPP